MSANNVFVSYKYNDSDVEPLGNGVSTVRDYVNYLEQIFDRSEKVYYRGEKDGEDLSDSSEDFIRQHLSDKIFYTTVTVVLISPNMYVRSLPENVQWIPWEISYSLKETQRESGKSHMNAVLAVVLPDRKGKYDYAVEQHGCHKTIHVESFFPIIRKNMFNLRDRETHTCSCGCQVYSDPCSYIPLVTWGEFIKDHSGCIKKALDNRDNWKSFDICKKLEQ